MPLRYLNRSNSSTTISAGNSVLFNGSNQYLSIANNAAFNLGTGSFTVECWFYATANVSSQRCLITNYSGPSAGWAIQITSGVIGANLYGDGFAISGGSLAINTWYHAALSGAQGSIKLFLNGVQVGSTYTGAVSMNTSAAVTIGNIVNTAHMAGYISNARVVKGTALYTSNFTPSTSPLTAIANTSLLTCKSATIVDASSNNFTITNNGAATVSSTVPFTASFAPAPSGMKFGNRNNSVTATQTGKSVQFNGTNQYLSVGSVANWAFLNNGSTPFTIEAWVNPTSVSTGSGTMIVSTTGYQAQIGFYFVIGNYNTGDVLFAICVGNSQINQWATSDNFLTANNWTHVAVSFTPNGTNVPSATVKFFVNGVLATSSNVYTRTTTYSTSNPTNTLLVGAYQTPFGGYFPGKMSNLRILNGTALYTASFTPPTTPLTAIANTALLTCNADTIIDGSSNNFTITNNNSATVSSITPFTVASAASTTRVRKVYADAVSSIVTSGLVLNLDASNASSYPGSGTSWFDLSGNSNTGTLTNGPTFNSANGGSIVFDGSNDYVSSFPTQISGVGSKTVSAWIKINKTSRVGLAGIRDGGSQTGWVFTVNRTTYGNLTYFHTGGSTLEVAAGIITNTWYNVCVTYNLTSTTAILYLNGVQIGSPSTSFTAITPSSFKGVVGNEDSAFSDLFSGNIAQTLIYDRALSASEVLQNYNVTRAKFGL